MIRWNTRQERFNIQKGEIIICNCCGEKIAEAVEEIRHGMMMLPTLFKGIQKPITDGSPMKCDCGASYYSPENGFCVLNAGE